MSVPTHESWSDKELVRQRAYLTGILEQTTTVLREYSAELAAVNVELDRRRNPVEAHTYVSPAFARVHIAPDGRCSAHVRLDADPGFVWGHNSLRHFGKHLLELADKLERK